MLSKDFLRGIRESGIQQVSDMNLMPNRLTTEIRSTVLPYIMQKLAMYMQKDLAVEMNANEVEQKVEVEQIRKHQTNQV